MPMPCLKTFGIQKRNIYKQTSNTQGEHHYQNTVPTHVGTEGNLNVGDQLFLRCMLRFRKCFVLFRQLHLFRGGGTVMHFHEEREWEWTCSNGLGRQPDGLVRWFRKVVVEARFEVAVPKK